MIHKESNWNWNWKSRLQSQKKKKKKKKKKKRKKKMAPIMRKNKRKRKGRVCDWIKKLNHLMNKLVLLSLIVQLNSKRFLGDW